MSDRDALLVIKGIVDAQLAAPAPTPAPTPTPTPTPAPAPAPSTVNYALYMGLTRAQAEAQRLHERVPGWSWADFAASGFMEPDGDFSGGPTQPGSDLGWSNGNPVIVTGTRVLNVTPSSAWLASPGRSLTIKGGYTSVGTTPPFVTYTIHGRRVEFNGSNQNWSTGQPDFPPINGPFTVTVELLDANRQPLGAGYAVAVELQHTP